jgi:hypothetical protein
MIRFVDEHKKEAEKQLEEARKKHLEGLKELREEYRKFDRGAKRIVKEMRLLEKKQDLADLV